MIVPPGVVLIEVYGQTIVPPLLNEEQALLGNVVESRRRDFALGRDCARRALAALGAAVTPVLCGASREPLWPEEVCGSITHCEGYAAAAVAWRRDFLSIGIDAEPKRPLPEGVLKLILTENERQPQLSGHALARDAVPWDLLRFSAKESVFKAWFPIMGTWLGFEEAVVEFDPHANEFRVSLQSTAAAAAGRGYHIGGTYQVGPTHVFTYASMQKLGT